MDGVLNELTGFVDPRIAGTVDLLSRHVAHDGLAPGAQLFVSLDGQCLADFALGTDGMGRANRVDTLYALYCSTKPLTALAIAQLVDDGRIELTDTLGTLLDGEMHPDLATVRLMDVLTHTAGLHHFPALWAVFTGDGQRDTALRAMGPAQGWDPRRQAGYSEYGGWHLLGRVVEAVGGRDFGRYMRTRILGPLGLTRTLYVGMSEAEYAENLGRLGANVEMLPDRTAPLLFERTHQACTEFNPGSGGRGSASGLGRLYAHLIDVLSGTAGEQIVTKETLARFTTVTRQPMEDIGLERVCAFGLGFMVMLRGHLFGDYVSDSAFGHSGFTGMSFAFADPDRELAVAVVYNGHVDLETSIGRRRIALCNELYRDLYLVTDGA